MTIGESVVINLAARYAAAFGVVAISNVINTAVITREDNKYQVDIYDDFDPDFEEISMIYKVGKDDVKLEFSKMLEGDGNSSIYAPPLMINFSREKNLIETPISGGDGVVVERWGTQPWTLEIRGVLIDVENRKYPTDKVQELCKIFEHNNTIKVVGQQFLEKGINSIYLKDISITPVEGYQDTIQFSLSASSISEATYTLLKPNE